MTKVIPHLKGTSQDQPSANEFPATGYVRVKQILAPLGPLPISRSGFWAGVKSGKFPRPRKISSRVGEHEFGAVTRNGVRYFWKIEYYNLDLNGASPDPADCAFTVRFMTIMTAGEYR